MRPETDLSNEIIDITNLSYRYPAADEFVLREINLRVERGEFIGVVGPTGSGKTTLCLALNGVVPHFYGGDFYGSITVAGLDTVQHPSYELAQHVGMVFQDPEIQLTAPTIAAEIAFALENINTPADEIRRRIPLALKAVRLEGMEDRHPHKLSGGQKQRLAIAAALALQPEVLVLDEPTSQLDPVGAEEVFSVARELNRSHGVTIILVSHASEEVAEFTDRVILLANGQILAEAPPREFFQNVELLRAHDVRLPDVTECFYRVYCAAPRMPLLPVTLNDALAQCAAMQPQLALRPAAQPDGAAPAASTDIVLQTRDLRYTYDDGTQAIRGITLDVRQGEYAAIVGQNGAGKSTLVRHFLHLLTATGGEVNVYGQNVKTYAVSELAQHIGFISQNPDNQIFCDTVEHEVAFALVNLRFAKAEVNRRVAEALHEMNLEWAADRHPLTLSKGDRSRIVIAAILAMKPTVLIFDEPTTGQDYRGARAILDLTRQLHRAGHTLIVITHHLYLLPGYAERLIVMGQGQVLLDAPLREAFYQTAKLRETFLVPPQVVQLAAAIQPPAGPVLRPITAGELAAALAAP
jgi:energy-coupling factor transporter ATP-binding protein EcfA2